MARCLRCKADSSWIEGDPPKLPRDEEVKQLRARLAALESELAEAREQLHTREQEHGVILGQYRAEVSQLRDIEAKHHAGFVGPYCPVCNHAIERFKKGD